MSRSVDLQNKITDNSLQLILLGGLIYFCSVLYIIRSNVIDVHVLDLSTRNVPYSFNIPVAVTRNMFVNWIHVYNLKVYIPSVNKAVMDCSAFLVLWEKSDVKTEEAFKLNKPSLRGDLTNPGGYFRLD